MARFLFFWVLAGALEFPFAEAFFSDAEGHLRRFPMLSLGWHAAASLLLLFSAPLKKGWLFFFVSLPFPLFGWAAAPALFFSYRPEKEIGKPPEEEEENAVFPLLPVALPPSKSGISKRRRISGELDLIPLIDIMKGDDPDLKRGAIEKLASLKDPASIDLLLSCRSDPSVEIRFFVTSALTRVKKELDEDLDAAKHRMQKNANDIDAHVLLAKVYLRHARSHLLDPFTARSYEQDALYHLNFALQSKEAGREVFQMLIDIYSSHDEWEPAFEALQVLEKRGIASPEEIAAVKTELLFHTRRYGELVEELKTMKEKGMVNETLIPAAFWWGA